MGDFNSNTPDFRGMEYQPAEILDVVLNSPGTGMLERFRSPGTPTISHVHQFLKAVAGNPGLCIEILDNPFPSTTETNYFPGTDTGSTVTGWEDNGNTATSAAVRAAIDDLADETNWARNVAAVSSSSTLSLKFRGSVTALTGVRIVSVWVGARMRMVSPSASSSYARVRALLNLSGTDYIQDQNIQVTTNNLWAPYWVGKFDLNPATNLPWTLAEANLLVATTATDEFGVQLWGTTAAAEAFNVAGLYVKVITVPENRKGFFYSASAPQAGWTERALTATAALAANTWYYRHVFCPLGGSSHRITIPVTRDLNALAGTDPAVTSGEHRNLSMSRLDYRSGVIAGLYSGPDIAMSPALLDASGTIQSPSNPYSAMDFQTFNTGATANRGQEITTASAETYAGVMLPVAWASATQPDQPLVITVEDAISGGNIVATATVQPSDTTAGFTDRVVPFAAAVALSATTKYTVIIKSAASSGKGWRVPRLDTRSDLIISGTTVAEIEGASQGGQTDSYVSNGSALDRYDLPVALVKAPTAPANFTAIPEPAE